jgi:hypothetical protein
LPIDLAIKDSGFIAGLMELRKKYPMNPALVKPMVEVEKIYHSRREVIDAIETALQRLQWTLEGRNLYPKLLNLLDKHAHMFTKKRYLKKIFAALRDKIIEQSEKHHTLYQDYNYGKEFLNKVKPILCMDKLAELSAEQSNEFLPSLSDAIDKLIDNPFMSDTFEKVAFKKIVYAYIYIFIRVMNYEDQCEADIATGLTKTINYSSYLLSNDIQGVFSKTQLHYWRSQCYAEQKQIQKTLVDFNEATKEPDKLDGDSFCSLAISL